MLLVNKYNDLKHTRVLREFICNLTDFLDEESGLTNQKFFKHYIIFEPNDKDLPIRVPGGTLGCVKIDDENKITDIILDVNYFVTYPEDIHEKVKKFIGEELQIMYVFNILKYALKEKYWSGVPTRTHFSKHIYYNSPYESDDNCGTCDGARCDQCKEIIDPPHMEFSIASDDLYKILIDMKVPSKDAKILAYEDVLHSNDYRLIWPNEDEIKEKYPEFYKKISTVEDDIVNMINEVKKDYDCFGDVMEDIKNYFKDKKDIDHLNKQLDLYWAYHENELLKFFKEKSKEVKK